MVQQPDQVIAAKYRLVRRLARGGMGSVWLGRHLELDIDVALKFLRAELADDSKAEARFRREARAAAALKSQHVVRVYDFGVDAGSPYLAMELLRGEDLRTYLERERPLSLSSAKEILTQAAQGVRAAHQAGIIHRDVKPSNLFLEESEGSFRVKVLDFGIAKGRDLDAGDETTQGQVFGSPAYMSPEQARGGQVDVRSDVWSLGAVFFEMVTGSPPFVGTSTSDVLVKLCTEDAPPPTEAHPELPPQVDVFTRRALQRDATRRIQNIDELLALLHAMPAEGAAHSAPSVGKILGRNDETAPLVARPSEQSEESAGVVPGPTSDSRQLRQSLVPTRPPKSSARGVLAVAGVLGILGLIGLGMRREASERVQVPEPLPSAAEELPVPSSAGRREKLNDTEAAVGEPAERERPRNDESTKTEPPPSVKKPLSRQPSHPEPSSSSSSPVRREADPIFGLPVESP